MTEARPRFNLHELLVPVADRSIRRLPRLVWGSFRLVRTAAPRQFAVATALQMVAGVGVGVQVLVAREVIDGILGDGGAPRFGSVLPALLTLAAISALVSFLDLARVEQQRLLTELVGRHAVGKVIAVASAADLLSFENPHFHDRLQRARVNAASRPLQMASGVLGIVSTGFAIAGIAGSLFILEPVFLVAILVAYLPAWFATNRAGRVMYRYSVDQSERDRRRNYLFRLLSEKDSAKEVRAFGLGGFLRRRHDALYAEKIDELRTVVRRRLVFGLLGGLGTSVLTAATLSLLVWFVTTERLSVAEAGASAAGIVLLGQRLRILSSSAGSLYEASLFLEDFTSFVDLMPAMTVARPSEPAPAGFEVLTASDVSFSYPSRAEPAVDGVSLTIRRGEVVALVGENGSGKTTLAKLLAGLYYADGGSVRWDDTDTATCDPDSLRDAVTVVFQDFARYFMTVAENIGLGRPAHLEDRQRIVGAAQQAGVEELVRRLPLGYETPLGPEFFGGSDLSVGQWQRVALARAFFRDAPFVILDEPTASLDPRAEAELFERIRLLLEGRSVLLITHRFSSARAADRIYVLAHGRVIEEGTHEALMAARGHYAELYELQAAAYLEPERQARPERA